MAMPMALMTNTLQVAKMPTYGRVDHSLAYKTLPNGSVEVYDLDFAGYCCLRGLTVLTMLESPGGPKQRVRPGASRQYVFVFEATADKIASICVDYANSESAKHADCVRRLKKGVRSTRVREG